MPDPDRITYPTDNSTSIPRLVGLRLIPFTPQPFVKSLKNNTSVGHAGIKRLLCEQRSNAGHFPAKRRFIKRDQLPDLIMGVVFVIDRDDQLDQLLRAK